MADYNMTEIQLREGYERAIENVENLLYMLTSYSKVKEVFNMHLDCICMLLKNTERPKF